MTIDKNKVCPICDLSKPIDLFQEYYDKKRGYYRVQGYCDDCRKAAGLKRASEHYKKNRERKIEYAKQYRNNPVNAEKIKSMRPHYKKMHRENISNCYARELLVTRNKVDPEFINKFPEVIQTKRLQLKIKRTIKIIKNAKK